MYVGVTHTCSFPICVDLDKGASTMGVGDKRQACFKVEARLHDDRLKDSNQDTVPGGSSFIPPHSSLRSFSKFQLKSKPQAPSPSPSPMSTPTINMKYRFLGNTGLLVSRYSYGCFMTMERKLSLEESIAVIERAYQHGINFFDTAENYADGHSEEVLGQVIKAGIERGTWTREDLVISTKIYFGTQLFNPNGLNKQGLSRKHVIEGAKASLKRLDLDYVDVIFCHRSDPCTPIEETVRAMNYVIEQGWAFYWGTSEWSAGDILEACEIADRLGLIRPVADQCQYNIFERSRVEYEYDLLCKKFNYGLMTFSPLSVGVLTGKYRDSVPESSRLNTAVYRNLGLTEMFIQKAKKAVELEVVAEELGCTLAQLALAWCAANENVATILFGSTSVSQLDENMKAMEIIDKITPEIKARINAIVQFKPELLPRYPALVTGARGKYMQ